MYRLIALFCLLSYIVLNVNDQDEQTILFSKKGDAGLMKISKEVIGKKTFFIFDYEDRTEKFYTDKKPIKIPSSSVKGLLTKTPRELRVLEKKEIDNNLEKSKTEGKVKVLLSINDLFPEIYLLEKLNDSEYLKYRVYWDH